MAGVAECGWAGGPGSVSCSHAETQTDLPACCGSFITSLIRQLAVAQSKLASNDGKQQCNASLCRSSPSDTAALPSAAPAADPEVAVQTGTGAAGQTELADDNTLEQGPDVEPQAPDQPVTDSSLQRSASEASQEAQTAPRTGSTVAAPQLVYDDLDIKVEDINLPGDTSQQGAAPEPDGQTTAEAGRSGADPSPAALGPSRPVRTRRKRCRSPLPPPEPVRRRRQTSRKQKAAAASEQSAGSSNSAPADGPAASPQPQPPRTARHRPASTGSSAGIGAVGAQPHAGRRSHLCHRCGKSFPTRTDLERHEMTHTGEQPYSCKECGRKFNRRSNLLSHRRTHTGDHLFSCDECGHKFRKRSNLIRHCRTHIGDRPFSCEECGRKFSLRSHLIRHLRIHTGELPYSCEQCGQKFRHQSSLIYHSRTHTGERPYSCKECRKKFRDRSSLIKHRSTHSDKWPFVCCSCGQMFSPQRVRAPSNCRTVPTGERQLQCAACKGSTALKVSLIEHTQAHTGK